MRPGSLLVALAVVCGPLTAQAPSLSLTCSHPPNLTVGQQNVVLALLVSNKPGSAATVGTITVNDTLPNGLSLVSMSGTGWTCNNTTCSRSDPLAGGSSSAISLLANIASNAPQSVTNQATASGGGSTAASCLMSTISTSRHGITILIPLNI